MRKIIFSLLVACAGFITASAQKFALVDMEYIMSNIPAYERASEQLNQVSKKWQAEVEALDNQAKTLYKNYQNEVVFLSEAQKKEREQAIVDKEKEAAELKKKYFGPEGELYKKRVSLIEPIQDEMPSQRDFSSFWTVPLNLPESFLPPPPLISATRYWPN